MRWQSPTTPSFPFRKSFVHMFVVASGAGPVGFFCNHMYLVASVGGPAGFLCNHVYFAAIGCGPLETHTKLAPDLHETHTRPSPDRCNSCELLIIMTGWQNVWEVVPRKTQLLMRLAHI